ncbi:RhuM family protein, partial [Bathymodiolus thermophilus thioautotrophic gill symbiont]
CSIDYDKNSNTTKNFFASVQNKFHYAITGQTAAEIIYTHADKSLPHMGLKTWKNAPNGRVLKSDTKIAKNYLTENEIKNLEQSISSYFDHIEIVIGNCTTMTMQDLADSVNKFLAFNAYKILE